MNPTKKGPLSGAFFFFALLLAGRAVPQAGKGRISARNYDHLQVGRREGKKIVIPANQVLEPAGRLVTFGGRPTDLALSPDGRFLAVLSMRQVLLLSPKTGRILSRVRFGGGSFAGILFDRKGRKIYASCIRGYIAVFHVDPKGGLKRGRPIRLPVPENPRYRGTANSPTGPVSPRKEKLPPGAGSRNALPVGLALSGDGKRLWAVFNLRNCLAEIDPVKRKVLRTIPVGNAPYGLVILGKKAYVTNWAGAHPGKEDTQGPSGAGSPVKVDPLRHIASEGTVSVVDLVKGREVKQVRVGLHPSGIAASPEGKYIFVANANSDTLSVLATSRDEVVETISTRPAKKLPFGSAPNALAVGPKGRRLYVSNGTNNAVAVIDFRPGKSRLLGLVPTAWYPAGIVLAPGGKSIYVANVKGLGSRDTWWKGRRKVRGKRVRGYNSHDALGAVSLIPVPSGKALSRMTEKVLENNRLTLQVNALLPPRPGVKPRPVPARHGEPSLFEHVVYIIKENRTYDQVLGDVKKGRGDPELCIFGRDVTPNHHKLVEEFVLLDNFYCNGVLSADGHLWADQAFVTDYVEKSFAGWPRSYPYWGGDAMAYASSGFLWDNALARGKTLRVFGEFVKATVRWKDPARRGRPSWSDCYKDFLEGTGLIEIRARASIKTLEPYLCPGAIGFPSIVSDAYRASCFLEELKGWEKAGKMPGLVIMLLPNDHTSGTRPGMPTPEASVADNDLALGRIVEGISRSPFWPKTCIFVTEDDPQNGFDHVDGHRTVGMVISPYTKRGYVDHTNYNQTSMVRTIELILGLPPMNQMDASATPMASCFTEKPDFRPYRAVKNRIPLDRLNPKVAMITDPREKKWALASLALPLEEVDEADEDTLNRILWFAVRRRDDTYPSWAVNDEDDR